MDDTLRPPGGHSCRLGGELLQLFQILQQLIVETTLNDVVFEEGGVCKLWTPVVHDLIEDLVDETELFFDIVLGDLSLAVRLADED